MKKTLVTLLQRGAAALAMACAMLVPVNAVAQAPSDVNAVDEEVVASQVDVSVDVAQTPEQPGVRKLLIINSYNEDELWANQMSNPVELAILQEDTIKVEKVFLNNSCVTDQEVYNTIRDNLFKRYVDRQPDYVVFIGNFAFVLRDDVVKEWGDIPMLLITRLDTYSPVKEYFTTNGHGTDFNSNEQHKLGLLRDNKEYNFSAVIVPDFYHANIEMMMDLLPDMKELVFISDRSYVNKVAASNLESDLKEMHPDVNFRWIEGSQENAEEMVHMFVKPQPDKGLLVSSWCYEVENSRGDMVLTTKDLTFMSSSVNPVFTMRQSYMGMGALGGAFADNKIISAEIEKMVKAMISGQDMRNIPFFMAEEPTYCVNYALLEKYGLDADRLPEGTIILNKPQSYLEKYGVLLLIILVALIVTVFFFFAKNKSQRRQIATLERHTGFINNLPMPYTKASLWLDKDDNVINITYEMKNKSYDELISNNSLPDNPLHLFDNAYLSDIAHRLITTSQPVSIRHHFKRTGVYCYMIFVPLELHKLEAKKRNSGRDALSVAHLDIDVFAIDITKDHKLQQQLKDQAVTIDISMEMAQLVPWRWDCESDTISFYTYNKFVGSGAMTTSDGKSTSVLKFEEFVKLLAPADTEEIMNAYYRIKRGECQRLDSEFRLRRSDSEEYDWCENHGVVTDTDSDGRPLRLTGSIQFITDRKRQQEEMKQALTKAKESDMLKSAFLANMSHEIRTPLNAIVGFSNLLTTTDDVEERQEFANIINRNNDLLLSLINDILDLAKIESNTITITNDVCDIHDLVSSISKTVSIRVPKDVKLNVAHYCDELVVNADASHISQILINLLTNATKFTKRGSITVGYEIYEDDGKIYFYVKDTGIGISKDNIDRVFNRFVKLNNFVQGSGLGLAICRTLVEKMGGEIGVESSGEGRGSLFWFTIPYEPVEPDEKMLAKKARISSGAVPADHIMGEHADAPAKIQTTSDTIEFHTPKDISGNQLSTLPDGLTVLVAEDNPSNYWLMQRLMQGKFNLHHAENGRIAVEMYDQVNPDIIVMDINMPELDGYGAVEELRNRGVTVPIIAVTAYAFASDRVRILNSGFDAFVSKPVSATVLYDTITDVWEQRKLHSDKNNDN